MPIIDARRLRDFTATLQKYKAGKASLERRVVAAENWWKLRNRFEEQKRGLAANGAFTSESGWLHNVIVSKHADAMEAYPEPLILPREPGDREQARLLSAIVPCILEQNRFERTYSHAMWQKLKTGTGCYRVVWDADKLGGLGDIAIERVDLLNLFWEPGVADIQDSRYLFCTSLEDEESLVERYPQLSGRLRSNPFLATRFVYDDAVSLEGKVTVIEVYYKKREAGRTVLHYCKYVGDTVLYATENEEENEEVKMKNEKLRCSPAENECNPVCEDDTTMVHSSSSLFSSTAPHGLYAHGRYPFVLDPLFPVEGSPCGYGFVDLCANTQTAIDLLRGSFVNNALVGSTPRYFERLDGSVNEEEFLDLSRPLVHVSGNLGEDSLRQISSVGLPGIYVSVLESTIRELRETSGNTETATGTVHSGVTAASAIAALQEASGKGSRDATRASYLAFAEIVELCIELIREFYTLPRQFRIAGEQYVSFSNEALRPRPLGVLGGFPLGWAEPVFDVKVSAQKRSAYSRLSQNELAMELYRLGLFEPGRETQALGCLELMEFDGKDELLRRVGDSIALRARLDELERYRALALALAKRYRPDLALGLLAKEGELGASPDASALGELARGAGGVADSSLSAGEPDALTVGARLQSTEAVLP